LKCNLLLFCTTKVNGALPHLLVYRNGQNLCTVLHSRLLTGTGNLIFINLSLMANKFTCILIQVNGTVQSNCIFDLTGEVNSGLPVIQPPPFATIEGKWSHGAFVEVQETVQNHIHSKNGLCLK
jgi:hypothetical protein